MCPYRDFSSKIIPIKRSEDLKFQQLNSCPPPLSGKRAIVPSLGVSPYVMSVYQNRGDVLRRVLRDKDGNFIGINNDFTNFLCEGLQCDSFRQRADSHFGSDFYSEKRQKWIGHVGDLTDGTADFTVSILGPRLGSPAFSLVSMTGYLYFQEEVIMTGYPKRIVSLFNIVKPFK